MKTIKYLVMLLCTALFLGACAKDDGLSLQNKDKEKPVVEIVKGSSDNGIIKFDVTVSENTAQYAYVILAGADNPAPEALNILTGEVSGAEAGESFTAIDTLETSYTASVVLDCSTFMNVMTEYEVFAVAITETGLVGETVSSLVVMNDTIAPELISGAYDNNMIQLIFSEDMAIGNAKASVSYFKQISSELLAEVEIPTANISVSGNIATIVCPKPAEGSVYYLLQLKRGAFVDIAGNQFQSIKTGFNSQGQISGLAWMSDPVTFAIGNDCFSTAATDWSAEGAAITFTMPFNVYESGLRDGIKVAYKDDWGSKEVITPYALGEDRRTVTVTLPEKPLGTFDLIIAEGLFYDDWGNWNAARNPEEYIYENYWLTIKGGDYLIEYAVNSEETDQFPSSITLVDRDIVLWNADWFNFFDGYALPSNLIGVVDYKTKTVIFDGSWIYNEEIYPYLCFGIDTYYWDRAQTQIMVFWGSGESGQEPIVMEFDDEGYITSTSSFDYSIYDNATGKYLGLAARTPDGAKVTYKPAERNGGAMSANAATERFVKASLSSGRFVK